MNDAQHAIPRGVHLLHDPLHNKGTAFTESERDALGLRGLLPPHVHTQDEQAVRVLENLRKLADPLEKFVALNALHDRNEALFFRVVCDNVDEIQPLIYTPTVGLACQRFGHIFQRPRGMFISIDDRGRIANVLRNWPLQADIIVVTDGERILGLGDQGANGMGIPVGKLSLYTACAGIHPALCLPITLDMGTNNETLLNDPYYVGLRRRRVTGAAYDELIEEFISAAREVFPRVIIQFEDFANHNAFRLLAKYRDRICTFNDDIQGTAAVVLTGILSALRIKGGSLSDEKLLFLGAGEAATGIADLTVTAMAAQGIDATEARTKIWLFDSKGLVVKSRKDLAAQKLPYAHEHAPVGDFLSALKALKPTGIIGLAAVGGAFTQEVLRAMTDCNMRPIVFALSNPTSKAECTAQQAYQWTDGRALFACGSPFAPVPVDGKTLVPPPRQQFVYLPGSRTRRDRMRRHPPHGGNVPCGSQRAGVAGYARGSGSGKPVPAVGEHPQRVGADRSGRRRGRLPARVGLQAAAGQSARLCRKADVRPALPVVCVAFRFPDCYFAGDSPWPIEPAPISPAGSRTKSRCCR